LTDGGIAMTGPEFRELSDAQIDRMITPKSKNSKKVMMQTIVTACIVSSNFFF
jgi:hypothetical protein